MLKDKKKIINETERDFSIWSYSVCKSLILEGPLRSIFGGSPEWVKWHIAIPLRLSSYVVRVQLSVIRLDTILHVYFFLKTTLPLLPFLFWFEASQGYEKKNVKWSNIHEALRAGRNMQKGEIFNSKISLLLHIWDKMKCMVVISMKPSLIVMKLMAQW